MPEQENIKVWDLPIRLFHWLLVMLFALSAYSAFQDKFGLYATMHLYAGAGVLTLVLWRILWGIWGSDTARFSHFIKGPAAIRAYLRKVSAPGAYDTIGHNPLGAVSVLLMVLLLLVQAGLGLFATDAMMFAGPLARTITQDFAEDLTDLHEGTGYALMALIALHILVIIVYRFVRRTDLVTPMITGRRMLPKAVTRPKMRSSLMALFLLLISAGTVWLLAF